MIAWLAVVVRMDPGTTNPFSSLLDAFQINIKAMFLFFLLSLLGEESPIFWISDSVRIDWYNKMNFMSHSILNANLLSVPLFV